MTGKERSVTNTGQAPWKSPLVFSVLLHCGLLVVALVGWDWSSPKEEAHPRSISATLVMERPETVTPPTPQPDRAAEQRRQEEQRRRQEEQQQAAEAERRRQAERQEQERRRVAAERERQRQADAEEAARRKAEAEAQALARQRAEEERRREQEAARQAEQERQQREQEARARQEQEARRLEAERRLREQELQAIAERAERERAQEAQRQAQAAADAAAREQQVLSEKDRYLQLIKSRLNQKWYRPPSATEGMETQLRISLLPTGELVSVELIKGSGNTAFDNAALGAARSVGVYPVPQDQETFNRYFRQFTLRFTPRDIR